MVEMRVEDLANEILIEIFEHLTITDLLRAFHPLNSRFHSLLFKHFHRHNLDFRSISKQKFDTCIRQYLPLIINQIKSLYLSNNTETPGQIQTFFSLYGLSIRQFPSLQSLSISHLHSQTLMLQIIGELSALPRLKQLKFIECRFRFNQTETQYILSQIFNQPKLTHCHLGIYFGVFRLSLPTTCIISSSLRQLHLVGWTNLNELNSLFHHFSHLQYLRLYFNDNSNEAKLINVLPSMISLNILVRDSLYTMQNILQNLPNLVQLKIETQSINLDGYEWEYLVSDHLPKLKIFQLKMLIPLNDQISEEEQVKDLLHSFQSRFWLEERRWFVRCHWKLIDNSKMICLYTLPSAFPNYNHFIGMKSQSTCSNVKKEYSYDHVHSLTYSNNLDEYLSIHPISFPQIRYLVVSFPINDYFYSVLPKLDLLISLEVSLRTSNDSSSLQVLLNQTSHLYALKVTSMPSINEILTKNTSHSIRRLDFHNNSSFNDRLWFDSEQCTSLACSSLGVQCEVLLIRVKNYRNTLDLTRSMNKLRVLNVECRDDAWCAASLERDRLVKWLEYSLPKTSVVKRDVNFTQIIRVWIGK